MTRGEAEDFVADMLDALLAYQQNNSEFRRIDYLALKARVIEALSETAQALPDNHLRGKT